MAVDKKSFDMLLGPLEELKKRGKDGTAEVKKAGAASSDKRFGVIIRKDLTSSQFVYASFRSVDGFCSTTLMFSWPWPALLMHVFQHLESIL